MERWIRVLVKEEIVLAHKNPLTSMDRKIEDEICNSESRSLELRFSNNICSPVLTGKIVKGEGCESLKVALVDSLTGEEVNSGPESSYQVQIFILEGDSDNAGGENWTHEEFDKRIVGVPKGKKSLLVGNVCLNLIKGTGVVPEISFTSNSRWMKNSRFRLGARIVDNSNRTRVKEAITKPFDLKDCRGKLYKSHETPSLCDEVWRLHKIGRNGPVDKRLRKENIKTVKDFLDLYFLNPGKLQEIFSGSAKNLEVAVNHARKCPDKMMCYPSGLERRTGVVFIVSGEVLGLVSDGKFVSSNMLSETEKDLVDKSVESAFEHWGNVISFDDQKYLTCCSSHLSNPPNSSPIGRELLTPEIIGHRVHKQPSNSSEANLLNEYLNDDILVFNDLHSGTPYQGLDYRTFESILENIDEIFSDIETQKPNVDPNANQQNGDSAVRVVGVDTVRAAKAQKSWNTLLFSIRFLLRNKCSKSFHVHKKPKLY